MAGEFERIRRYFLPLSQPPADPPAQVGNGDDALAVRSDETIVMSVDTAVAGTHFPPDASAEEVATKALRSALSDLAAMGARPWFYTLSLVVPKSYPDHWWQQFAVTLQAENRHWQFPCLGGDTTTGDTLVVTVQVHGLCERPLTRSGAAAGQNIWLVGQTGEAAAGLAALLRGDDPESTLRQAFYQPQPPVRLMAALQPWIESAIDISDGLVADLGHIARASDCDMSLQVDRVPLSNVLVQSVGLVRARELALSGGEDYTTVLTAWPEHDHRIMELVVRHGCCISRIGQVADLKGEAATVTMTLDGEPYLISQRGYDHFG